MDMMPGLLLPGYVLGGIVRRAGGRTAYRAQRVSDGLRVCIETLADEFPGRRQVAEMVRDGQLTQRLGDVEGVLRVFAVERHGSGNVALVTEPFEQTLADVLLESGRGMPVARVLDVALRLVRVLGAVHARDIVHKAVTPANVLFEPVSGELRLRGFAIASELEREGQRSSHGQRLEGPLPYLSPEQTGRMSREVDYRSDYYSLGVTLFELLTGQLPFHAEHVLGWVHCHISRSPPSPSIINPLVPEPVSAIVLKLLAKAAEQRYQSPAALEADLLRCKRDLARSGVIAAFIPGQGDLPQRFLLPQHLYGRDREVADLLALFEHAAAGGKAFCLVHGYSGVGKSALVSQLDRPLVRERGFFVQGKFDQYRQGEAFSALASAFRSLVQQALADTPERLATWRRALLDALAPNAQLIVERVPELELIIGSQPAVTELPPAEARNRLQIVLGAFVRVFAAAGHPLVLFLDDLQWSDIPTLALLKRLVSAPELGHLLLIGAYRSNEVGPGHPLRMMLDELQAVQGLSEIALAPLEQEPVTALVADALRSVPERAVALGQLLFEKGRGNPFFTTELLNRLHQDRAIKLDVHSGQWVCDLKRVHWAGLSGDVVEFMVEVLRQQPTLTQRLLELAACIGGTFDLHTLSQVCGDTPQAVARGLLPALQRHLVVPLDADYRLVDVMDVTDPLQVEEGFNPHYRFLHDRVQQAAYALIEPERLQQVQLSIGRLMLAYTSEADREARVVEIVGHLNHGRALINDPAERQLLAHLNVCAGARARQSAAYEAALEHLRIAEEFIAADAWLSHPDLAMALASELQQCAYLTGRQDEADARSDEMLQRARSDLERASILVVRTRQHATLGRMDSSIAACIQGLSLLGVEFTATPDEAAVMRERQRVDENLCGRAIADLVDAPAVQDPATLVAMRLLMEIFAAAFLSGSGRLFPYLVLKAVNLSLKHGNSPESAFAYAAYGMLLCGELNDPALGHAYGRVGLAINERLDDVALRTRVVYVYAMFVHHWSEPWASLTEWFRKGIEAGYQSGDLLYLAYSAQDCVIWDPTLDLESAAEQHAANLEIVHECAYQDSYDSGSLFLQLQRNFLGQTFAADSLSDEGFDEAACLAGMEARQFMTGIANYHIYKAEACFLHGLHDQAMLHVQAQDTLIKSAMSLPQLVRFYIVSFLVRMDRYRMLDEHARLPLLQRLLDDLRQMRLWANNCADNFLHLQRLMEAELAALEPGGLVLKRFDDAIECARASGFLRDEAVACERAARYLIACGHRRAAEGYLRAAYSVFARWGARRKLALLVREFPVLRPEGEREHADVREALGLVGLSSGELDLASLMKASRVISSEIVLERLLQTSMDILLENAAGEWGCLVVQHEDGLFIEALSHCEGVALDPDFEVFPATLLISDRYGVRHPLPVSVLWHVLRTHEAIVLHDAVSEGEFRDDPYVLRRLPRSVVCVPIRRDRFNGVVYLEHASAPNVFSAARVEVLRLLAAQAAVAIENAQLYEQVQDYSRTLEQKVAERTASLDALNRELQALANRDGLTGVANRRRGDTYLGEVWRRLKRERQPLSLIMFDVDFFKRYNDNYGHQMGDDCLVQVAAAARSQLRRSADLVARYGGEEFMIILPDTDEAGSMQVAEAVRSAVEQLHIPHAFAEGRDHLSISLGVATVIPDVENGIGGLVQRADGALYVAKRNGRNQFRVAGWAED